MTHEEKQRIAEDINWHNQQMEIFKGRLKHREQDLDDAFRSNDFKAAKTHWSLIKSYKAKIKALQKKIKDEKSKIRC